MWVPEHYRNGVLVAGHWRRQATRAAELEDDAREVRAALQDETRRERLAPAPDPSTATFAAGQSAALEQRLQAGLASQRDLTTLDEIALAHSPISRVEYGDFGGCNTVMLVQLQSGQRAYHKPISGMDEELAFDYQLEHAGEQALHEVAAWRVAKAMGAPWRDLVAPTVLRDVDGHLGSMSLELPGRPPLITDYNDTDGEVVRPDAWDAAGLFDAVIGNQDRHLGNVMHRRDGTPGLFDHGLAFRTPGDYVNESRILENRLRGNPELNPLEITTLRALRQDTTLGGAAALLSRGRVAALQARIDHMLDTGTIYNNRRDYDPEE